MGRFDNLNISTSEARRLITWTNNTVESLEDICTELEGEDLVAMQRAISILNERKQAVEVIKVESPQLETLTAFITNDNKFIARFSYTPTGGNGSFSEFHIPRIETNKENIVNSEYKFITGRYREYWVGRVIFSDRSLGTHDLVFENEPTLEDIDKVCRVVTKLNDKQKYAEIFE